MATDLIAEVDEAKREIAALTERLNEIAGVVEAEDQPDEGDTSVDDKLALSEIRQDGLRLALQSKVDRLDDRLTQAEASTESVTTSELDDVSGLAIVADKPYEFSVDTQANDWNDQFELYYVDTANDKVRITADRQEKTGGVWFRGVKQTIANSTMTTSGHDTYFENVSAISADAFVYLKVDRTGPEAVTVTMEIGTSLPNGDDDTYIFPLYYVPFGATITTADIVDMRFSRHVLATA